MGKFVIEYDGKDQASGYTAAANASDPHFSFVVAETDARLDGLLQKSLCYTSYYIMTFSAFCAFSPDKVATAAEMLKATING